MKCYSVLKKNELSSHGKTQRTLQCLLLSERTESEKVTHCVTPTIRYYEKKARLRRVVKGSVVARGCGGGEG